MIGITSSGLEPLLEAAGFNGVRPSIALVSIQPWNRAPFFRRVPVRNLRWLAMPCVGTEAMVDHVIMVVDDDEVELQMMGELLADAGYRTLLLSAGAEAYELIRQQRPALAILDLHMAEADTGWQILNLLRADPATSSLPVILCSADGQFLRLRARILRTRKHCDILEKPFSADELLEKVAAALESVLDRGDGDAERGQRCSVGDDVVDRGR